MSRGVVLSITGKCNYRCRHCSVSAPKAAMGEMSFDQVKYVLQQLQACGLTGINLIGGEPMVHPHFRDIIEYILAQGMTLNSIFTNGSLLTEEFLCWLEERCPKPLIRMSFDGLGFHDKMRGIPGAEERLYKALALLKEHGFTFMCDMSITKESLQSLPDTVKLLEEYGAEGLTVYPPQECGNWQHIDQQEKLDLDDMVDFYCSYLPRFIEERHNISLNIYSIFLYDWHSRQIAMMYDTATTPELLYQTKACRSYDNELNISAAGYLSPCYVMMDSSYVKENMPNIFQQPLQEILQDSEYQRVTSLTVGDIVDINEECRECGYRTICGGGCRGMALFTTGDIRRATPTYCHLFKGGGFMKLAKAVRKAHLRSLLGLMGLNR